jgi:hypothetical protein
VVQKADLNSQLTPRNHLNLRRLVDPFDCLQHVLGCIDVVNKAASSRFLEELEEYVVLLPLQYPCDANTLSGASELHKLIDTVGAFSRGESRSLKNRVAVHASRLHDLIEGFDVSCLFVDVIVIQ